MRLLIVGATGGTGRQLVTQALERGHEVTALVRRPEKIEVRQERLVVLQGNVLYYNLLEAAMRGQEAVLCALGHKRWLHPTRLLSEGTRNLVRAMETHRVRRLVCETSLGLGESTGRMGFYYTLFVIPFCGRHREFVGRRDGVRCRCFPSRPVARPTQMVSYGSTRRALA